MKNYFSLLIFTIVALVVQSCFNPAKPNYQYFPNMYEPVGYETYADSDAFANGIEAQIPVDGTVARGWEPYDYADTNEGYEDAKQNLLSRIENTPEQLPFASVVKAAPAVLPVGVTYMETSTSSKKV